LSTHDDPLWYKDAVFYELHPKAFQDSNADGIGDFGGLMQRLDYVQELGVDCIWLLPCYPSPLRDDGYDIADYYSVHPNYGTLEDFDRFIAEAHRRGLKVIADLVLNHTSDQHPWFQRARRAPKGSPERDFYVWTDDPELYKEARIIFIDTEPSNWTYDPVAGQYFWHRFFSHQPDLNWDNPVVEEEMSRVMEFWLERGLDGFRADAVPYLIEREGTNCENLPETHVILKRLRKRLETKYPGRILLAEANQWPDDVRPYFGDGDEFHMAFHFPVMPRIFMAVRQGIRKPITEIIQRTPEIPPECQWCMFLRNHDELTLEMVTDEERDYMYSEYAKDPRMRLNLGIRRRLAPLMENDRRKIELLNSILFTMPGSPIVYYGDELGMGDNIWLGDRDGVRTPMQWSPDRNAGFSRAETARLYLPLIVDSVYGYQAINVEAQQNTPFSLLNWMKRLIQVRKQHHAFGRGSITFLEPENQHVLAYLREHEGDVILCVHNLSGAAQAVRLDLSRFSGSHPVELLGGTEFLPVDETPYALTLAPYGFFWFGLRRAGQGPSTVTVAREWGDAPSDAPLALVESGSVEHVVGTIPHEWIRAQRWFRGKARAMVSVELADVAVVSEAGYDRDLLTLVRVAYDAGDPETYLLPLLVRSRETDRDPSDPVCLVASPEGELRVHEAFRYEHFGARLLEAIERQGEVPTRAGVVRARNTGVLQQVPGSRTPVRVGSAEQSNTSILYGDSLILKVFRKVEPGTNPDLEVTRFLTTRTDFRNFPALAGWLEYVADEGTVASVAALSRFVPNRGDGWQLAQAHLREFFAAVAGAEEVDEETRTARVRELAGGFLEELFRLGEVTGRLHAALASDAGEDEDFEPEVVTEDDVARWLEGMQRQASIVLGELDKRLETIPGSFPATLRNEIAAVVRDEAHFRSCLEEVRCLRDAAVVKSRAHGDYHLGQVLLASEGSELAGEWVVIDFEGEPQRPLEERRAKVSPLRDVAGMLRSFNYAWHAALRDRGEESKRGEHAVLEPWGMAWEAAAREAFLAGYAAAAAGEPFFPRDPQVLARALRAYELDKALYELNYEMNNRPEWLSIPLRGVRKCGTA
jgi:maltose alpha-D-glucosyltransferase/alpha-amylase